LIGFVIKIKLYKSNSYLLDEGVAQTSAIGCCCRNEKTYYLARFLLDDGGEATPTFMVQLIRTYLSKQLELIYNLI
jgi:hypothetical protein